MLIGSVLNNIEYKLIAGSLDKEITSVEFDSRKVSSGSLFVCVKGFTVDGHTFAAKAAEQGASALAIDINRDGMPDSDFISLSEKYGLTVIEINDTHKYLSDLCANFYDHPENKLEALLAKRRAAAWTQAEYYDRILKNAEAARIRYREFVALYPDAPERKIAEARLAALGGGDGNGKEEN